MVRKYSGSPAEVRFTKYVDYGFPNCIYGVSLQMIKAARGLCRGMLNTSANCLPLPGWAHMSLMLSLTKEWKTALTLLEVVGIFWGNVAFARSAIMLHGGFLLRATARAVLGAGWIFGVSHPPFTSSEIIRACLTATGETYSTPSPGDFPLALHSQFSVLHSEGFTEPEIWPLLPPCG